MSIVPSKMEKIKKIANRLKEFIIQALNHLDADDYFALKNLLVYSVMFGLMLNYSLFVIFHIPFTWYSWIGWGFGLWLLENKLITFLRRIIRR